MGRLKINKEAARRIVEAGTETRTSTRQTVKRPVRGRQIEIVEEPESVEIYVGTTANELKAIKFGDGLTTSAQTATLGNGGYLIKNNGVLSISNGLTGSDARTIRGAIYMAQRDFNISAPTSPTEIPMITCNYGRFGLFLTDSSDNFLPTTKIGRHNADLGGGTGNLEDNTSDWTDDYNGTGVGFSARKVYFADCNLWGKNEQVFIQPKRYSLYLNAKAATSVQVVTDVALVDGELVVTKKTIALSRVDPN